MNHPTTAMLAILILAACSDVDEVDDVPFEGIYQGQCEIDVDGNLVVYELELLATFDAGKGTVTGTGTAAFGGDPHEGTLTGSVSGEDVDLSLVGEGEDSAGNFYSYDLGMSGTHVSWWIEGLAWNSNDDAGTLFLRAFDE